MIGRARRMTVLIGTVLAAASGCHPASELQQAVRNDDTTAVSDLLAHGANVREKDRRGMTPLHWAAYQGHVRVAELLLDRRAAVDALDRADRTPLALACSSREGSPGMVRLLLDHGAKPDGVAETARPIYTTVRLGKLGETEELLKHGADPNGRSVRGGETPLHVAAQSGRIEMVDVLLKHGANPNVRAGDDATPMQLAEAKGNEDIVALLRHHGAKE